MLPWNHTIRITVGECVCFLPRLLWFLKYWRGWWWWCKRRRSNVVQDFLLMPFMRLWYTTMKKTCLDLRLNIWSLQWFCYLYCQLLKHMVAGPYIYLLVLATSEHWPTLNGLDSHCTNLELFLQHRENVFFVNSCCTSLCMHSGTYCAQTQSHTLFSNRNKLNTVFFPKIIVHVFKCVSLKP